jgi:hypothetical protein
MRMRPSLPRYAQAFALAIAALSEATSARAEIAPLDASPAIDGTGSVIVHLANADAGSAQAHLTIDGRDVAAEAPIEVGTGKHVVRLETPGRAPIERSIDVHLGDHVEVALDATAAPPIEPPNLGGVPPSVKPRGGCAGCGGAGSNESAMLGSSAFAIGAIAAFGRRRRR